MWINSAKLIIVIMIWCCHSFGSQVNGVQANLIAKVALDKEAMENDSSDGENSSSSSSSSSDSEQSSSSLSLSSSSSSVSSSQSPSSSVWKSSPKFSVVPSSSFVSPQSKSILVNRHHKTSDNEDSGEDNEDSEGPLALIVSQEKSTEWKEDLTHNNFKQPQSPSQKHSEDILNASSENGRGWKEESDEFYKDQRNQRGVILNSPESSSSSSSEQRQSNLSEKSSLQLQQLQEQQQQLGEQQRQLDFLSPEVVNPSGEKMSSEMDSSSSVLQTKTSVAATATFPSSSSSVASPIVPDSSPVTVRIEQGEKLLLEYLMRNYERDVRPVVNSSQPVVIEVGITLTQIFDMDEKSQVLSSSLWLDQEWYDELLRWDPKQFGGLESIRLPCERIWLPDIVLYNNADDYTQGYMPSRAMVSHDGKVFWPPPTKMKSTCPVDVTYFPFDDQICTLKLGSWTYNGFQVDVMNRTSSVDLSNYVSNGEWELLTAELKRNVVYYSCCPEPFPDVTITLIIRRKTLYYIYNVVLPCMMLSVLTLLVFCLPPDSGEKIALGITVLLAFSVFMLAIAEKMPETSESIPLIGIYLTAVMAITSVSVIVTVVVLNLHYLGPQVHRVPPWLRCFLPNEKRFRNMTNPNIRQKSWLIPSHHREPRSGSLKRGHVFLPPNRSPGEGFTSNANVVTLSTGGGTNASSGLRGLGSGSGESDHHFGALEEMDVIKEPLSECSSTESVTNESPNFSKSARSSAGAINYHPQHHSHHHNTTTVHHRQLQNRQNPHHKTPTPPSSAPTNQTNGDNSGSRTADMSKDLFTSPTETFDKVGGSGSGGAPPVPVTDVQEELLRSIRHLIGKQEEIEAQNLLVAEWRLVAQAIDKILFWIFFIVTLASSAVFLVILPLYKRSFYGPK